MKLRPATTRESGFGLLEMLISTTLTAIIVGGVLMMLGSVQFTQADLADRSDSQQGARMAMNWLQRDLSLAGVGLTPMVPVFPLVVPREDGGVIVRYNRDTMIALIAEDTTGRNTVEVPGSITVSVGDQILIFDNTGTNDITVVTSASPDGTALMVQPLLTRNYLRSEGSSVAHLQQIEYWLQGTSLMRSADGEAPTAIADGVLEFEVAYFDDQVPAAEFAPSTAEAQLRIRVIEVRLRVQVQRDRLAGEGRPETEMRTRISPRALSISRS